MTAAVPIAELERAGLRYGSLDALVAIDLRIAAGERVALIGPSGAGKTSLISLLNGSLAASTGAVRVLGHDLAELRPRELRTVQSRLATIHQQLDLVGALRVIHNINAGRLAEMPVWRALLSLGFPRDAAQAQSALQRVGIADKLYERTDRLSGGEQQRVAIARVLVRRPSLTLADEPIASVDPARGSEIIDLLLGLSRELGSALLVSLHDLDVALSRFDRVIGLRAGAISFDAPPSELSQDAIDGLYAIAPAAAAR